MSKPATAKLSADDRAIFGAIADFLVPKTAKMPAATEVGVAAGGIDDVLKFRPDLIEARGGLTPDEQALIDELAPDDPTP